MNKAIPPQDTGTTGSTQKRLWLLAVVIALGLGFTGVYIDSLNNAGFQQKERADTLLALSTLRASLEGNLNANLEVSRGLLATITNQPNITQEQFAAHAKHLFTPRTQLRNIAAAPGLVVKLMYPLAGNERAIGLDYSQSASQRAAANQARDEGSTILAGPVDLVQGGQGLIARIPVFVPDPGGKNVFWGPHFHRD